jgi:RNA polymerase sigma-70 factor (ECF subfamily)
MSHPPSYPAICRCVNLTASMPCQGWRRCCRPPSRSVRGGSELMTPPAIDPANKVSGLLQAWGRGDLEARDALLPQVYQELRRLAAAYLRRERPDHSLAPTALVHEAYLRLVGQKRVAWQNRAQFFGIAAQIMRRVLVDHARERRAAIRGGVAIRVLLDDQIGAAYPRDCELLLLDQALTELTGRDARLGQVVELRYFGGLSEQEIAVVLSVSRATVTRDWHTARAWLYRRLTTGARGPAR